MRFKEPIEQQPLRILESGHICNDLSAFAIWLELDYQKCRADLLAQNGATHIIIQGWHVEPAVMSTQGRRRKPVRITSIISGKEDEYGTMYEASVALGLSLNDLYQASKGRGPYALSFKVEYI